MTEALSFQRTTPEIVDLDNKVTVHVIAPNASRVINEALKQIDCSPCTIDTWASVLVWVKGAEDGKEHMILLPYWKGDRLNDTLIRPGDFYVVLDSSGELILYPLVKPDDLPRQ